MRLDDIIVYVENPKDLQRRKQTIYTLYVNFARSQMQDSKICCIPMYLAVIMGTEIKTWPGTSGSCL
jgi:hypothetical protein